MFTDMIGYTALGQRNEPLALALVDEQRKLIRPILRRHTGREVKTIGDGFLVEFPNALEAVRCAYDIQRAAREFNFSLPEDRRVRLRIGVHVGDVVKSEKDLSGDAVNVASRIEPLSEEGGVCISRQVYDLVQNKFDVPLSNLGPKNLKNVSKPLEVYRMVMPWERESGVSASSYDRRRVAVLPFSNISPDPNDAYISDGLTEELISTMSKISGLNVLARTSVMRYRTGERNIQEIADELKVSTIIEGSVRKASDKVRVTVLAVDTQSGTHVWSESYDREMKDVFAVQVDISRHVASTLKVRLLDADRGRLSSVPTSNPEAHALCLKGIFYNLNEFTSEAGLLKSKEYLERAVELDPTYPAAYAWLSDTYCSLLGNRHWPPDKALPGAEAAAAKALSLDPNLPEAHRSLGFVRYLQGDLNAAEAETRAAISLNANDTLNHSYLAEMLRKQGKLAEAASEAESALELAPLETLANHIMTYVLYYQREYGAAIERLERMCRVYPDSVFFHAVLGRCYLQVPDLESAITAFMKVRDLMERGGEWEVPIETGAVGPSDLAVAYARAGRIQESMKILDELREASREHVVPAHALARIEVALGRHEDALDLLEKALQRKEYDTLDGLRLDPMYDDLRQNPRFISLLAMYPPA